jgi:hypothetical protein
VQDTLISSREVQTFQFEPGDQYQFQIASGLIADFTFKVTDRGKVDYEASFNGFLSGRGTDTLMILGWEVTFDCHFPN